jgi:hypothetical protein
MHFQPDAMAGSMDHEPSIRMLLLTVQPILKTIFSQCCQGGFVNSLPRDAFPGYPNGRLFGFNHCLVGTLDLGWDCAMDGSSRAVSMVTCLFVDRKNIHNDRLACPQWASARGVTICALLAAGNNAARVGESFLE